MPRISLFLVFAVSFPGLAEGQVYQPDQPLSGVYARLSSRHDSLPVRFLHAPFTICAGGDLVLGSNIGIPTRPISPDSLMQPLLPLFANADIALVNVEGAIGRGPSITKCRGSSLNCFAFRMPPSAARAIRGLLPSGAVVANIANNHAFDAGPRGRLQTIKHLAVAGIYVTGADTAEVLVPLPSGDTIAFLGFHTTKDIPVPDARDTALVRRLVARASARWPVVIVTMHLGAEGNKPKVRDQTEVYLGSDRGNPVAFATAAVTGGAALVLGHGPHVLRGIEWAPSGALVAYSLGNLVTYGAFSMKHNNNIGGVLCTVIDTTGRVSATHFQSTIQDPAGFAKTDSLLQGAHLISYWSAHDFDAFAVFVSEKGTVLPVSMPDSLRQNP